MHIIPKTVFYTFVLCDLDFDLDLKISSRLILVIQSKFARNNSIIYLLNLLIVSGWFPLSLFIYSVLVILGGSYGHNRLLGGEPEDRRH